MEEGRAREEDNEDDSRCNGRDIPVEIIMIHPGLALAHSRKEREKVYLGLAKYHFGRSRGAL